MSKLSIVRSIRKRVTYIRDRSLGITHAVGLYEEFIGNEEFII
ncbi:MAG: hypothetical protein QXT01_04085 [Sulfolobales archaeon]